MKMESKLTECAMIDRLWTQFYSKEVLDAEMPKYTIYEYIKHKNKAEGKRIALEYFGNKITYKSLIEKIDQCADALAALGIHEGDIVSICMPTTPEVVYLFYALSKIGAVSNMIDPRKSAKEIEEYTNEVKSKVFFGIDVVSEKTRELRKNTTVENIVIITLYESFKAPIRQLLRWKDKVTTKMAQSCDASEFMSWPQFISKKGMKKAMSCKYRKDMPVTIVHTGGTTGKSKGVILSNDNINCGAYQCEICGLDFSDRGTWLDIMPPFIAYGVGNGLHLPLSMGMKTILLPKFDPSKFDEILLKHRPNYMAGVPSHYGYLLKSTKLAHRFIFYKNTYRRR